MERTRRGAAAVLVVLLGVCEARAAASPTSCHDLASRIAVTGASLQPAAKSCFTLSEPTHAPSGAQLVGPLVWDTGYAAAVLFVNGSLTLDGVTLLRAFVYPISGDAPFQPAALALAPGATVNVSNSVIETSCELLTGLRGELSGSSVPGIRLTDNALLATSYVSASLQLTNVSVRCNDHGFGDVQAAVARVSTGAELQAAVYAASQLQLSVNVTLTDHITLAGAPRATWPPAGYAIAANLAMLGGLGPGASTVLDLAGLPAFVQLRAGAIVRWTGLQVQGLCVMHVALVPQFGLVMQSTNDVWAVYTGDDGPTAPRVSKLLEVSETVLQNTPQELAAATYWLHTSDPPFEQLEKYNVGVLHGAIVTPDAFITLINTTSISYRANLGPSVGQLNTTSTTRLPIDVARPGFNGTVVSLCTQPNKSLPVSDPALAVNRTLSPVWLVPRGGSLLEALTGMAGRTALNLAIAAFIPNPPAPLVLVLGTVRLPPDAAGRLIFMQTDALLYGPDVLPDAPPPGNPTAATIDFAGSAGVIRLPDSGAASLFITRVTLRGLPTAPLTAGGAPPNASAPQHVCALPLWFVRSRPNRQAGQNVFVTAATLELPREEWRMLLLAAVQGSRWRTGPAADYPLVKGLSFLEMGPSNWSAEGLHLSIVVGWGVQGTNLWLVPDVPFEESLLQAQVQQAIMATETAQGGEGGDGVSVPAVVGGVVGAVAGIALAMAAAILYARRAARTKAAGSVAARHASSSTKDNGLADTTAIISHTAAEAAGCKADADAAYGLNASLVGSRGSSIIGFDPSRITGSGPPSATLPRSKVSAEDGEGGSLGACMTVGSASVGGGDRPAVASEEGGDHASAHGADTAGGSGTGSARGSVAGGTSVSGAEAQPAFSYRRPSSTRLSYSTIPEAGPFVDPAPLENLESAAPPGLEMTSRLSADNSHAGGSQPRPGASTDLLLAPRSRMVGWVPPVARAKHQVQPLPAAEEKLPQPPPVPSLATSLTLRPASLEPSSSQGASQQLEVTDAREAAVGLAGRSAEPPAAVEAATGSGQAAPAHVRGSAATATSATSARWDPRREVAALAQDMRAEEVDKLQLLEAIGQGGYGAVFRGRWRGLEVAIKTVLFSEGGGLGAQQRAVMEAAVCTSVAHPNVVATYHYDIVPVGQAAPGRGGMVIEDLTARGSLAGGTGDWKLYLVQEYCHASLYYALNGMLMHVHGKPDMDLVLTTLLDIARGMQYLHSKNIVHGDIKPENVLLKNEASAAIGVVAKLTDFGLSNRLDPSATHVSNITNGTPFYAAPEVVRKGQLSKASDVYSFGVLMWEMYNAAPPWQRTRTGFEVSPRFPNFPPGTPAAFIHLTLRCLDANLRARPTFAALFVELTSMHSALLAGFSALVRLPMAAAPSDDTQDDPSLDDVTMLGPPPAGLPPGAIFGRFVPGAVQSLAAAAASRAASGALPFAMPAWAPPPGVHGAARLPGAPVPARPLAPDLQEAPQRPQQSQQAAGMRYPGAAGAPPAPQRPPPLAPLPRRAIGLDRAAGAADAAVDPHTTGSADAAALHDAMLAELWSEDLRASSPRLGALPRSLDYPSTHSGATLVSAPAAL